MALMEVRHLSFAYPAQSSQALHDISFSLDEGAFCLLCGPSGCGKTTLLRQLKRELQPFGQRQGEILLQGQPLYTLSAQQSARAVGFVLQNPSAQIVTDTVWHELAFGLENLGIPSHIIRRRVAETAHFFGITSWFEQDVRTLSGGQQQILNLAAVMVMQPQLLILDEPICQLDPIAARDFLQALWRVHEELGTTILLCEHELEDVLPLCDQVLYLQDAALCFDGPARTFAQMVLSTPQHPFTAALPAATRIVATLLPHSALPLSVRQGRRALAALPPVQPKPVCVAPAAPALSLQNAWFRYDAHSEYVLRGATLSLQAGRITGLVGGNGSGKSTLLSVLAGLHKLSRGKVQKPMDCRVALLHQDPQAMLVMDTVEAELMECAPTPQQALQVAEQLELSSLWHRHPYDLSGGEMQRLALGKVLLRAPDVLLLDEPTKGLDTAAKASLIALLRALRQDGKTLLLVTHDLAFAASVCDTCAMLFRGEVLCADSGKAFFAGNHFYTTAVNRLTRGWSDGCVTLEDVLHD